MYLPIVILLVHESLAHIASKDVRGGTRTSVTACVMTIAQSDFNYGEIITLVLPYPDGGTSSNTTVTERGLLANLYNQLQWTVLTRRPSTARSRFLFTEKSHNYILQIKSVSDINNTLLYLKDIAWNPHAKFIIITSKVYTRVASVVAQIAESLWTQKAVNAIILLPEQQDPTVLDVYTWFPYAGSNCANRFNESRMINRCANGTFESKEPVFMEKVPNDLHGCPITARVVIWPPYVIAPLVYNRSTVGINFTQGLEVSLLNTVANKMNATILYTLSNKTLDWGTISIDGNATGLFEVLVTENIDIGAASIAATVNRFTNLDYSLSYAFESIAWCVPRALVKPRWLSIFNILTPESWLYVTVTYMSVALCTWALAYWHRSESTVYRSRSSCFLNMLAVLISVSVKSKPRLHSVQVLFLIWCMFSLNLTAVYQTYLINYLVKPTYQSQMKTIEAVFEANIPFGYLHVSRFYFGKTDDWIQQKLVRDAVLCYDADECLSNVASARNYTFAVPQLYFKFTESKYKDRNGRSLLYGFKEDYVSYPIHVYTYKGFPLLNRIDQLISNIQQTGIQAKWESDLQQAISRASHVIRPSHQAENGNVLTLEHLQGAFIVFALGNCSALVAFLLELMAYNVQRRQGRRPFLN